MLNVSITVVVPLFNNEATIRRAVESVVNQLGAHDELIIVNDGSTDQSVSKISSLIGPFITVVHQPNLGVSAARNAGVRLAKNDYIAFLDSDDYWLDSALNVFRFMVRTHPEGSLFSFEHTRNPDSTLARLPAAQVTRGIETLGFSDFMALYSRRDVVNSSSTCVRKSALNQIGGFPVGEVSGEDIYVWILLATVGVVVHDNRVLAVIEDRHPSEKKARPGIPFHYRWFLSDGNRASMSPAQRQAVTQFLLARAVSVCAGAAMSGLRSDALGLSLMISKKSILHGGVAAVVSLAPRSILLFLRSLRKARKV